MRISIIAIILFHFFKMFLLAQDGNIKVVITPPPQENGYPVESEGQVHENGERIFIVGDEKYAITFEVAKIDSLNSYIDLNNTYILESDANLSDLADDILNNQAFLRDLEKKLPEERAKILGTIRIKNDVYFTVVKKVSEVDHKIKIIQQKSSQVEKQKELIDKNIQNTNIKSDQFEQEAIDLEEEAIQILQKNTQSDQLDFTVKKHPLDF